MLAAVVGVLVLLAAAVWINGLPAMPVPGSSIIQLETPSFSGNVATILVNYVSPPVTPSALLLRLDVNGSSGSPIPMPTTSGLAGETLITALGYAFQVGWLDLDGDGALSTGDTFVLAPQLGLPGCCASLTFNVLWKPDGLLGATVTFYPPPTSPSEVIFGTVSRGTPTNVYVPILGVIPPVPPDPFYFRLRIDGNVSGATHFPTGPFAAANVSFVRAVFLVVWYDNNYSGLVDSGDSLNITMVSGSWPAAGTPMAFILEWNDGTELAVATWNA